MRHEGCYHLAMKFMQLFVLVYDNLRLKRQAAVGISEGPPLEEQEFEILQRVDGVPRDTDRTGGKNMMDHG